MSETLNANSHENFRRKLLTTVSALALSAAVCAAADAADQDADRPTVWIGLGGQLNRLDDTEEVFAPSLMASRPSIFTPSQQLERPPLYSIDETGEISFQPDGSNWILSASVRYGRSANKKDVHQQTHPQSFIKYNNGNAIHYAPKEEKFAETDWHNRQSHLILDFQAGRDVGLGMFGRGGSSVLNFGVRFAQFSTKSNATLRSDPDWHFSYKYSNAIKLTNGQPYHSNAASIKAARSFHGVGPSISWNAATPFLGNRQNGELTFDWGLNAAVLFGRQSVKLHHQTTARYHQAGKYVPPASRYGKTVSHFSTDHVRARSVIVPNVGSFAGLSVRYVNVDVSVGYRADFFLGAVDGGIDARKRETAGFYGPFASISVGL